MVFDFKQAYSDTILEFEALQQSISGGQVNKSYFQVKDEKDSALFFVINAMTLYRAKYFFVLEPETIRWLNEIGPKDVLLDIGANIGSYSIWTARSTGAQVVAIEPESQSFALLVRNIALNGLQDRITPYCVAASDHTGLDVLYLTAVETGHSNHQLGAEVDAKLQPVQLPARQGCMALELDEAIGSGSIPTPSFIKIDVDGFEHLVIGGLSRTLKDSRLRSILIEINPDLKPHRLVIQQILDCGFDFHPLQTEVNPVPGEAYNHIFVRRD